MISFDRLSTPPTNTQLSNLMHKEWVIASETKAIGYHDVYAVSIPSFLKMLSGKLLHRTYVLCSKYFIFYILSL